MVSHARLVERKNFFFLSFFLLLLLFRVKSFFFRVPATKKKFIAGVYKKKSFEEKKMPSTKGSLARRRALRMADEMQYGAWYNPTDYAMGRWMYNLGGRATNSVGKLYKSWTKSGERQRRAEEVLRATRAKLRQREAQIALEERMAVAEALAGYRSKHSKKSKGRFSPPAGTSDYGGLYPNLAALL
jgi:hypothetical protein